MFDLTPLKRLLVLWQYLKRCLRLRGGERGGGGRKTWQEQEQKRGGSGLSGAGGRISVRRQVRAPLSPSSHGEAVTVCESRRPASASARPLSALGLQLDPSPHGPFLQPTDIPSRPVSMVNPGSSPVHSGRDMRRPQSYTHSEGSSISISVQSTSDQHRGRHLQVAHPRPDARPMSRAAARGIARVASRAPSRATSASRSRAPSRSPMRSVVDLPNASGTPAGTPKNGSHLALPNGSVAQPSPDPGPSISLPDAASQDVPPQEIYPILAIPRYDHYPKVSPDSGNWKLMPVTTAFPL